MKEKQKNSTLQYQRLVISLLKLLLGCTSFVIIFIVAYLIWAYGGYVKSSLDFEYVSDAKNLYENPKDGYVKSPYGDDWLAFHFQLSDRHTDHDNLRWAELIINKQTVRRSLEDRRYGFVFFTMPAHIVGCIDGRLDSGYHIIEFKLKESAVAESYYIRKFAVLVE